MVNQDMSTIRHLIDSRSDSEIAIGGAALIDHLLYTLLHVALKGSNKQKDPLLKSQAACRNLAYCLGLITLIDYGDICKVSYCRNRFAHDIPRPCFDDEAMVSLVGQLSIYPQYKNKLDRRAIFVKTVYNLTMVLNGKLAAVKQIRAQD